LRYYECKSGSQKETKLLSRLFPGYEDDRDVGTKSTNKTAYDIQLDLQSGNNVLVYLGWKDKDATKLAKTIAEFIGIAQIPDLANSVDEILVRKVREILKVNDQNLPQHIHNEPAQNRKWPRNTITLLADYIDSGAISDQVVDWAVLALMDGFDSHNLCILAGLDLGAFYPGEKYDYFLRSIKDLGIDILDDMDNILVEFSGFVCQGLLSGEIDAKEALSILGGYFVLSNYSEPLFLIWYELSDEIDLVNAGYGSIYDNDVNQSNQNEYIKNVAEQYLALLENPTA